LEPVDAPSVLCPEAVRVAHAFLIPVEIGCVVDERVSLCLGKNRVKLFRHDVLLQHCANRTDMSRTHNAPKTARHLPPDETACREWRDHRVPCLPSIAGKVN